MPSPKQDLIRAAQLQQAGALAEAEALCQQIVRRDPYQAEAWDVLGNLACQTGKAQLALDAFQRAKTIAPNNAGYRNSYAGVLLAVGRAAEAEADYRETLRLVPRQPEAHYNLGKALEQLRRLDEASACYRRALELRPNLPEAHNNLGTVQRDLGHPDVAIASYRRALELRPDFLEALNNLGGLLAMQGKPAEAEPLLRRAIAINPNLAEIHCNLGDALRKQERFVEAEAACRRALDLKPAFSEAFYQLGNTLQDLDRLEEADDAFRHALELRPTYVDALNDRGYTLQDLGRLTEAEQTFRRAIELQPNNAEAHKNLALLLLTRGDFVRGWPEYEWRWQAGQRQGPNYPQPAWDGSPLSGKTILLHSEQGQGDTIQFIRYAALVKERGATVLVHCPPRLVSILRSAPDVDEVIPKDAAPPPFDVHAPLLSLPRMFGTDAASIPAQVPYLAPDATLVTQWRQRLREVPGFKIGLVWQGDPKFVRDRRRSVPLAAFAPLAEVPGVSLVSLQVGPGSEQLAANDRFAAVDLGSEFNTSSFEDAAAVVCCLDLVVSVDTAMAHLAGALGVPVWIALPYVPDWRWLLEREDSPWYPKMRLFRQRSLRDWDEVLRRMAERLGLLVFGL